MRRRILVLTDRALPHDYVHDAAELRAILDALHGKHAVVTESIEKLAGRIATGLQFRSWPQRPMDALETYELTLRELRNAPINRDKHLSK